MDDIHIPAKGVGARALRKEDARHLRGRGQFVGDLFLPGLQDVAFYRSPVAHARVLSRARPPGTEGKVFFIEDLTDVSPIITRSSIPGYKVSEHPVLAREKVRFVGEPIAMCVGKNRASAEDLADGVVVDFDELPPIVSSASGRTSDAALLHESWGDNLFLETTFDSGIEQVAAGAPIKIELEITCARQTMHPLEGKGVFAFWDYRAGQLVVHTSTQIPHLIRTGLSECGAAAGGGSSNCTGCRRRLRIQVPAPTRRNRDRVVSSDV
jgi:aerobic carbon-monoxide dehydrogenase large subunit